MASIDLNRYNGTLAGFNQKYKLNLQPLEDTPTPPPPEPEPEPGAFKMTVTAPRGLNVRSGPGVSYPDIGDLPYGSTVNVLNVGGSSAWVEIDPGKWVCVQLSKDRYMGPD